MCRGGVLTRTVPSPYVVVMLSALLVIGGVLVGLFVLLAVIVSLSARPQTTVRPHPDAWSPPAPTGEIPAIR